MGVVLIGTVDSSYRVLQTMVELQAPISLVLSLSAEDAQGVSDYIDLRPLAEAHGVPHRYVKQVNAPDVIQLVAGLQPDVIFVIGWSQLVGAELMRLPRYGCVGAHPALLPKNRGRAVIPWALIQDEPATGMTLFYIDEGTDSGDIIAQTILPISDVDTAQTIYDRAVDALCQMLREQLPAILANVAPRITQDHSKATYCARRRPEDGLIDWNASSRSVFNLIRAVGRPYPGAFTFYRNRRVTVWAAAPADEVWVGLPGQILRVDPTHGALVKTGNGAIWLNEVEVDGQVKPVATLFKRAGEKLGLWDALSLIRRIEGLEAKL